jgi:hypothetical protein
VAFIVRLSPANVVQPKKLKHGLCINSIMCLVEPVGCVWMV